MNHVDTVIAKPALRQGSMNLAPVTNEVKGGNSAISLQSPVGALADHTTAVVATHDIHCNSHKGGPGTAKTPFSALEESSASRDGDHLTPFVIAAGGADSVRHVRGRALRTGTELRQGQHAVIGPAHALTAS